MARLGGNPENQAQRALVEAVRLAGGQSAMARLVGVAQPSVWKWLNRSTPLPAEHVLAIEVATGVSRYDLRPDIYPRDEHPAPTGAPLGARA